MAESAPETRGDWALRRLRSAILTGEFPPGTKLRAEELAERWQVSPTPLREAFQRLGGAGLVEVSPQRGVRVAEFTLEDAADLYALRLRLEPAALRHSLRKSDDAHRARDRGCASLGSRRRARSTRAPKPIWRSTRRCSRAAPRRGRGTSPPSSPSTRSATRCSARSATAIRDPRREHRELRDAALAGQVDEAETLLTKHLRGTLDSVRAAMDAAPAVSPKPNAKASRRRRAQEQPR